MIISKIAMHVMRDRSILYTCALVLAFGAKSGRAVAGETESRAETLFQEARDLMGQGDFAHACPKLEQAYALDHGAGTLLALAVCHEGEGKPATALREYRESLAFAVHANRPDRVMLAESHVQQLEAKVPRIKIRPPSPEPAELVVTIDDAPVDRAAMIAGTPIDPGAHVVTAKARDVAPWSRSVEVAASAPIVVVDVLPTQKTAAVPIDHSSGGNALRAIGWVTIGVGVAAAGVGSVFGGATLDAETRSQHECQNNLCTQHGVDLNAQARRDALVSDIGLAVGGVALVVGIYFLVRSASHRAPAPTSVGAIDLRPKVDAAIRASSMGVVMSW